MIISIFFLVFCLWEQTKLLSHGRKNYLSLCTKFSQMKKTEWRKFFSSHSSTFFSSSTAAVVLLLLHLLGQRGAEKRELLALWLKRLFIYSHSVARSTYALRTEWDSRRAARENERGPNFYSFLLISFSVPSFWAIIHALPLCTYVCTLDECLLFRNAR